MSFCESCGHRIESGNRFCENCGVPVPTEAESAVTQRRSVEAPAPRPSRHARSAVVIAVAVGLAVVAVAVGAVVALAGRGASAPAAALPGAAPTTSRPTAPAATVTATATVTRSSSPDASPETRSQSAGGDTQALTASDALDLGASDARRELSQLRIEDMGTLRALSGKWVPQVSSKCEPMPTHDLYSRSGELGLPDGRAEQYSGGVGPARILAFHLALRERFGPGVMLGLPDDLDFSLSDQTKQMCGGAPMWTTVVLGSGTRSKDAALAWCDAVGLPWDECGARPVRVPGEAGLALRPN